MYGFDSLLTVLIKLATGIKKQLLSYCLTLTKWESFDISVFIYMHTTYRKFFEFALKDLHMLELKTNDFNTLCFSVVYSLTRE